MGTKIRDSQVKLCLVTWSLTTRCYAQNYGIDSSCLCLVNQVLFQCLWRILSQADDIGTSDWKMQIEMQ